jgi:hypothetical protein
MPETPPDPGRVLNDLRLQLQQLRALIAAYPSERAYVVASEHVAAAVGALETVIQGSSA